MRGDKAIRLDLRLDRANALAALGLSGQAMSEANAEALRAAIEAFNSDGVDAALPYLHPEIVWNAPPEWLEKAVYRGHEGLRELAASWGQNFDAYRLDVERVVELGGGRALVLLHQRGRIKGSGHPMEQAVAWIVELVHRRLTRVDVYFTWGAAIEAAGIRV